MPMCDANLDAPKTLRDQAAIAARLQHLHKAHVAVLTAYVKKLRRSTGKGGKIPYFDPLDGGTRAQCLFVFEAPGRRAVKSGFISRNNPDETAKNFLKFNNGKLDRNFTALWNIVPWFIGTRRRISPATTQEVRQGLPHLSKVISLFPRLRIIVLAGKKAQRAYDVLKRDFPSLCLLKMPHPSPQCVNRDHRRALEIKKILSKVVQEIA